MRRLCLSVVSACSACLSPPGLTLGPPPAVYFFCLSAVDSVSSLCGGLDQSPKVGEMELFFTSHSAVEQRPYFPN